MSDDKPIGVRVQRPYATREEFLDAEAELLGRSHVTLVGAKARPPGTLLRFEVVLDTGEPVIRAEGRVVGPREIGAELALYVKLTRIDNRTKATLDEAAARKAVKLARSPSQADTRPPPPVESQPVLPESPDEPPSAPEAGAAPGEPEAASATPEPAASAEPAPPAPIAEPEPASVPMPPPLPLQEAVPVPEPAPAAPESAPVPVPARQDDPITGPHDRNALLARLRSRLRGDA